MQGAPDDDTDRWFGMFRSVGMERLGEARATELRAAGRRSLRESVLVFAFAGGFCAFTSWWSSSNDGLGVALIIVYPAWQLIRRFRLLSRVLADERVEFFEGRVPLEQVFRDSFTDKLISAGKITAGRSHRLTVHPRTGVLLDIDGTAVSDVIGDVVVTARVAPPTEGAAPKVGDRRPLTIVEAEELEAIHMRRPIADWGIAVAFGVLATAVGVCLVPWGLLRDRPWLIPLFALISLATVRFVQTKSAEATRARVDSDRSGGLVYSSTTTWRLPVLDLIWERDGLPGFKRLERGGLKGALRSLARPQTF